MRLSLLCLASSLVLSCQMKPVSARSEIDGVDCGVGTEEVDGECVPIVREDTDADTDADADADADTDADTDADVDTASDTGTVPADDSAEPEDTAEETGDPVDLPVARVYVLAGQSNMDGGGQEISLPASLRLAQEDVKIFWSGSPAWRSLMPSSYWSSGWGTYFGPEVTFGRTVADALPDEEVFLIKHAIGGTALADFWFPGADSTDTGKGEGYTGLMSTYREAVSVLEDDGYRIEVAGMVWMQGESDAYYAPYAIAYEDNLTHFVDRIREDFDTPDMPFVMGLIDCEGLCTYREPVRTAQSDVAAADPMVWTIETEDLGRYPDDGWHYHGVGMRVMGERFAQTLLGSTLSAVSEPAFRITGSYTYSWYGYYTVGYRFSVDHPIELTDLGLFDLGMDGLSHASDIGIWNASTGELLATETLPATESDASPLIGNFRYVAVAPLVLPPGEYVLGSESFETRPDFYVYDAVHTAASGVTWLEGRHVSGSSLSFPTVVAGATAEASLWFGPNILMRRPSE